MNTSKISEGPLRGPILTAEPLAEDVKRVLSWAQFDGNWLKPLPQMERALYVRVDEVLTRLRGKWQTGKGHCFPYPAEMVVRAVLEAGVMPAKNPLQYFPSPRYVVEQVTWELLPLGGWEVVLEPSAGTGAFLGWLAKNAPHVQVDAVEMDGFNFHLLEQRRSSEAWPAHWRFFHADFLEWRPDREYSLVLMNPPFDGYQAHVLKAWSHLRRAGRLRTVVPASLAYASDRQTARLLEEVVACGDAQSIGQAFQPATGVEAWVIEAEKGLPSRFRPCNGWDTYEAWNLVVTVESSWRTYETLQRTMPDTLKRIGSDLLGAPPDMKAWRSYWRDLLRQWQAENMHNEILFILADCVLEDLWRHYAAQEEFDPPT